MSEAIKKVNVPTATTVLMVSALLFAVMMGATTMAIMHMHRIMEIVIQMSK